MSPKNKEIALAEGWFVVPVVMINERPFENVWWHKKLGDPKNPVPGATPWGPPNYELDYKEALETVEKFKKYF